MCSKIRIFVLFFCWKFASVLSFTLFPSLSLKQLNIFQSSQRLGSVSKRLIMCPKKWARKLVGIRQSNLLCTPILDEGIDRILTRTCQAEKFTNWPEQLWETDYLNKFDFKRQSDLYQVKIDIRETLQKYLICKWGTPLFLGEFEREDQWKIEECPSQ